MENLCCGETDVKPKVMMTNNNNCSTTNAELNCLLANCLTRVGQYNALAVRVPHFHRNHGLKVGVVDAF